MDSRSLKALHPSLSCGDLGNRDAELGKFWVAPVSAPGKMSKQNVPAPAPDITYLTVLIRISLSFHFTFTNLLKLYLFGAGDALSLTVLAPAPSEMFFWCQLRNLFEKSPVEPKEDEGN